MSRTTWMERLVGRKKRKPGRQEESPEPVRPSNQRRLGAYRASRRSRRPPGLKQEVRLLQCLEPRSLMAIDLAADSPPALIGDFYVGDFHQSDFQVGDIDRDGVVAPLDALTILNTIEQAGGSFTASSTSIPLDVDHDGWVSESDVDLVLAQLTSSAPLTAPPLGSTSAASAGTMSSDTGQAVVPVGDVDAGDVDAGGGSSGTGSESCSSLVCAAPPPAGIPEVRIRAESVEKPGEQVVRERKVKPDPQATDGYFYFELSAPLDHDLVVQFSVDGQAGAGAAAEGFAVNGLDHSLIGNNVKIPAGKLSVALPVLINNDQFVESTERIRLLLVPGDAYQIVPTNPWAELQIVDNDAWGFAWDNHHNTEWKQKVMLPEWDASLLQGFLVNDKFGWCEMKGGLEWQNASNVNVKLNAKFHGWTTPSLWGTQQERTETAQQQVGLKFNLNPLNGLITMDNISGPVTGFDVVDRDPLRVGIGYSDQINNQFAAHERRVEVTLNSVVGILGTMESERTGGALPNQAAVSAEGSLEITHTVAGARSSTPLNESQTFIIRSVIQERD
ncbi:MAG: dockerin type I domain-containing protein [Planctomycetota bacterium]